LIPSTTETTDEGRDEAASKLVDRFSLWSGAAGLIPLPIVDIVAVGGVQLEMLRRLSDIYGVPFVENRGKSLIASLAGSVLPASTATTTAMGVTSALKSIPGIGTAISAFTMPVVLGRRHLRHRQGFHPALRFGRNAARLQPARLSRIHQAQKEKWNSRSTASGVSSPAPSANQNASSPGATSTISLRVPTLTALPRSHVGLAGAMMDRETWPK
jgi:uncharacterized protein (DUF697 family)